MARRFHDLHGAAGGFTADVIARDGFGPEPWFSLRIAELSGEPAGYALFHRSYETGHALAGLYLADLWVEPEARGRGAGRALLRAVAEAAEACGARFVWLVVQPWNAAALGWYAGLGASGETVEARAVMVDALLCAQKR